MRVPQEMSQTGGAVWLEALGGQIAGAGLPEVRVWNHFQREKKVAARQRTTKAAMDQRKGSDREIAITCLPNFRASQASREKRAARARKLVRMRRWSG